MTEGFATHLNGDWKKIVIRRYSNQKDFLIAEQHFACFLCYCDCFYAW